ncbi:hypothetical protein DDZ13_12095 [Coraliomargarita sinensis]|uniref:Beta-mannosidase-like galactose-binding domain-containing protein n=1 Tax=Coraliomargarita sinensis TaxID=2174842 RepID=A0A317ZHG7_9BACT|nr:glycosyl hydrolase [Coraliomargarita sinensis]PXA03428.1 hypothetical protein DDZ13_12095 [Coraliomargarita sinensis]
MKASILFLFALLLGLSTAEASESLRASFQNPPESARAHTWWHWMNGNVTREGITADLEAMAAGHLGGATIFNIAGPHHNSHIPQGEADYLGPVWLDRIEHAANEAERLGLTLGMHNCAGWSTTGGPWVTPELGMQQLVSSERLVEGGQKLEIQLPRPPVTLNFYRDVALFAIPADADSDYRLPKWQAKAAQRATRSNRQPDLSPIPEGASIPYNAIIELTSQLNAEGRLTWEAPAGKWKLIRMGHTPTGMTNRPAPAAGTGLEIDKLRRDAVDLHWNQGIQPILDRLGKKAGPVFNEILIDSYEAGLHHWTPKMRDEFEQRRGYDPGPYLLALTGRAIESGGHTGRFYWDFRRTVADLFNENYYGYMAELCHARGLQFAAEPYTSTFEGMQVGSRADVPMGEFWVNGSYLFSLRMAASIANTTGKKIAGAEAFTASPEIGRWQNHPASLKQVGDLAWTLGINRYILHGWVHQPWLDLVPGMTMGQYGSHFGRTNTWWKPGHEWLAYIQRAQFLLQSGHAVKDVLCFAGNAAPNNSVYRRDLDAAGYGYDSCSTEAFLSLEVENGELVLPSGARYKLLFLRQDGFHTPEFARKLRDLVAAGARVYGPRPSHSPSLKNFPDSEKEVATIGKTLWGDAGSGFGVLNNYGKGYVYDGFPLVEALQAMNVEPQVGLPEGLTWTHRRTESTEIFFISNQSEQMISGEVDFRVNGRVPELWDAESGAQHVPISWRERRGRTYLPLKLAPGKSVFVVFEQEGSPPETDITKIEGPAGTARGSDYHTGQTGTIRFWDKGTYTLYGAKGETTEMRVDAIGPGQTIRGPWKVHFQSGAKTPAATEMDQLFAWEEHDDPAIRYFSGTGHYRTKFQYDGSANEPDKEVWLDLGEVHVIAEVTLNGQALRTLWHPPYRVEVTDALRDGNNTLEVSVSNLWINRLIGDAKFEEDVEWSDKSLKRWPDWLRHPSERPSERSTFATWKHWGPDDALRPSGLVGPVKLREARMVEVRK